jgi:hypothetical protein
MSKKIILAVLLIAGITAGASAQTVYGQQRNERNRIEQGVRNGSLTRGETRRLEREQRDIHRDIRNARRDGYMSPYERANIRREERYASRDIYRAKHNRNDRYYYR